MPFGAANPSTLALDKPLCYAADRRIGGPSLPVFRRVWRPLLSEACMRRYLALVSLLALPIGGDLAAQALDDTLVPQGRVRLQMFPVFTSWDSRFGQTDSGVTGRESLGDDLTTTSAESLFPGTASLIAAIESMSGASGYTPVLGETIGRVGKDVTRVEFGGHIGIFDWLTVGAVVPWTRTRTNVDVVFRPDTLAGDLGLNPTATDGVGVDAFLQALSTADAAAQANASSICGTLPGSPSCISAQGLAARTAAFSSSASTAYTASPFFPITGSSTAASLAASAATLDADLMTAGLLGIGAPMVFASEWVGPDDFAGLSSVTGFGVEGARLGDVRSLWNFGDVEVSASVRLLEGALRDSAQVTPWLSYRVIGTVLGRLPTGVSENPDVFLDVGTGDRQADVEGRLFGELMLGRRLGVRGAARYGIQMPRTLVRRGGSP